MTVKRLFVYSSDAETNIAKQHPQYDSTCDICFVAKTNAYALPKKTKAINATVKDFVFQYAQQFETLLQENDVSHFVFVAPNTLEGCYWLGHWHHLKTESMYSDETVSFVTYTAATPESLYLPEDATQDELSCVAHDPEATQMFQAYFDYYVFNHITASIMYTSVLRNISSTLLKSKKASLSLGMYRCLATFASFENPRCLHFSLPNLDAHGQSISDTGSPYVFDPYEAAPVKRSPTGKHSFNSETQIPDSVVFNTTTMSNSIEDPYTHITHDRLPGPTNTGLIEPYHPYISCLLSNIPVRRYHELVKTGVLSVPQQYCVPAPSSDHAAQGLTTYFDYLSSQYVLSTVNTMTLGANIHNLAILPMNDCVVMSPMTKKISECFDYSILYDKYFTRTLTRYCIPNVEHEYLNMWAVYGGLNETINEITKSIPVIDTSNSSTGGFGWVGLVDSTAVLKLPLSGQRPIPGNVTGTDGSIASPLRVGAQGLYDVELGSVPEIGDGTIYLANMFNVMACFGYTSSYTYALIRTLARKGYLQLSTHGCRITAYGYAVCQAFDSALHSKLKKPNKLGTNKGWSAHQPAVDRFDVLSTQFFNEVHDYAATYNNTKPTFDWDTNKLVENLDAAKQLLHDLSEISRAWKGYKVTVKKHKKSLDGKPAKTIKVVYRLRVDRKSKHAWFEARKRKSAFVHAKVTTVYDTVRFGSAKQAFKICVSKLIPGPVGLLKSNVIESPCPECGCLSHKYKRHTEDISKLMLECEQCHRAAPAVFLVEANTETGMLAERQL